MRKQVTFDVPEVPGYEYVRFGLPKQGDYFLDYKLLFTNCPSVTSSKIHFAKENFRFDHNIIYRKLPTVNPLLWAPMEDFKDIDLKDDQQILIKRNNESSPNICSTYYWNQKPHRAMLILDNKWGTIISIELNLEKGN